MTATLALTPARPLKVALIGNPNTGKSTLFNALAGLHARVANYPGVTVEKKIGRVHWGGRTVDLVDLPGTYSLSPRSRDEMVSVDVLLGRQAEVGALDAVVCIADASNLERHLYLLSQILDTGVPAVLVLNMWDTVARHGVTIDVDQLRETLGIPVVTTEAHRRRGISDVRQAVLQVVGGNAPERTRLFPAAFYDECAALAAQLRGWGVEDLPGYLQERMLLDSGGAVEAACVERTHGRLAEHLRDARSRLASAGFAIPAAEPEWRHQWARRIAGDVVREPRERKRTATDVIDAFATHWLSGFLMFAGLMFCVFQAIYAWAAPLMDACEAGQAWMASLIEGQLVPGPFRSLLVDGIVAGVGSVLIFVPQIALLFLFIALLEDCGYMARAAYIMDRLMAVFGLSGKSFLPLMSSFACAVPGIMATRVIDSHRDRMVTILIAPLMSCSARLPVYLLLIGAFVPGTTWLGGRVGLQGLVLFAMSSLGLVVAIPVAWLLKRTFFKGENATFVMELPDYKVPAPRLVLHRVYDRSRAFVQRAGTLIFATTILVWAAGYFPGDHTELDRLQAQIEAVQGRLALHNGSGPEDRSQRSEVRSQQSAERDDPSLGHEPPGDLEALIAARNVESAALIRHSLLGRMGRAIEPVVAPLGWDWKIGVGVIASFPAREVIIATLGTIYSLGGDVDEESEGLVGAMQAATWPDGRPVYNLPVALSIMVFFALCAQCASTLMIIRRETNHWKWPVFCFVYMTGLAYVGALLTYQIGRSV